MVILVGIGAGVGAVCRYLLTVLGRMLWPGKPIATMMINVLGAFLAGLPAFSAFRVLLLTGFCGGFTTFSTFMADAFILIRNRQWRVLVGYYLGSVLLGVVAMVVGLRCSSLIRNF
ncbi:CrcB family protein [Lacticaseibacillus rhamnosus]|uniref:fluoride efflux transporter FluC n=1 Tax=Lacticaseibacillus rhamnosus TaxID=47715 RepID=UPI00065A9591|nr:CrcB family protein [Lacticaseibacillus rhamnosus]KMO45103.1 membrane protein [Lacticaseibacillus rhamnosus]MCT3173611.1 CrcB family protein [Lacticaseibacillus rhamnosus]MCT3180940.1 CrcB family protein [Lacticaseibacillus rhamnosus]